MVKEKTNSKRKIIQRLLVAGVGLGVILSILRMALALFIMTHLPAVMNVSARSAEQPSASFMLIFAPFILAIAPYAIACGAVSAFLYVYLFPDKESRSILIGWGVMMTLFLIGIMYLQWL